MIRDAEEALWGRPEGQSSPLYPYPWARTLDLSHRERERSLSGDSEGTPLSLI